MIKINEKAYSAITRKYIPAPGCRVIALEADVKFQVPTNKVAYKIGAERHMYLQ